MDGITLNLHEKIILKSEICNCKKIEALMVAVSQPDVEVSDLLGSYR